MKRTAQRLAIGAEGGDLIDATVAYKRCCVEQCPETTSTK